MLSPDSRSTAAVIVPEPLNDQHLFPSLLVEQSCHQTRLWYDTLYAKFSNVNLTEGKGQKKNLTNGKPPVDVDAPSLPAPVEFTADCG